MSTSKTIHRVFALVIVTGLLLFPLSSFAQEHPTEHPAVKASSEATKETATKAIEDYVASEAELNGGYFLLSDEKTQTIYSNLDRIEFSTGRDIQVQSNGPSARSNYFIYPYVSIDRVSHENVTLMTSLNSIENTESSSTVNRKNQEQLDGNTTMPDTTKKTDAEWQCILTSEQYRVMREKGTEPPFTGSYVNHKEQGIYHCSACGNELFRSQTKFNSGTGWPSFYAPYAAENITEILDTSHGMMRTEIICSHCGAHLGHVFDDGPAPTGQRYCINSVALQFAEDDKTPDVESGAIKEVATKEKAMFGAGCFWGVEAAFRRVNGVISTSVGYSGGTTENPSYQDVCSGMTGHAEVVQVVYDPSRVSYDELLRTFWTVHDPTQVGRQGVDIGDQYRSAVFYYNEEQRKAAEASRKTLQKSSEVNRPIATEIAPASAFYLAEDYHQQYLEKRGKASCGIR